MVVLKTNVEHSYNVLDALTIYSLLLYPLLASSFLSYRLIDISVVRMALLIFMTLLVLLRIIRCRRVDLVRVLWTIVIFIWILFTVDNYAVALQYLPYLLLLWVPANSRDLTAFRKFIIFAGVFCAIGIFTQLIFPSTFKAVVLSQFQSYSQIDKIEATFSNRNSYFGFVSDTSIAARYISFAIAYLFLAIYNDKSKKRASSILLLLFLAVAVILTGKRTYCAGLVISLFVIYLSSAQITKKFKRILIALLLVVVIVLCLPALAEWLNIPALNRIVAVINMIGSGNDSLVGYRLMLYDKAITYYKENQLLGIGWRNFRKYTHNYAGYSLNVHNIYLQLLCEMGIIGFVLFILFFVREYYHARKLLKSKLISYEMNLMLLFIHVYFLICGVAENELYVATGFAYYFIACALAKSKIKVTA